MTPITEELIRLHLEPIGQKIKIRKTIRGHWIVKMPCGGKVVITKTRIDGREVAKYLSGIELELFFHHYLSFSQEVWGTFGMWGLPLDELGAWVNQAKEWGFNVSQEDGAALSRRYFGPEAKLKIGWQGWRVTLPDGRGARFCGSAIEEVWGGKDACCAALGLMHEVAGEVVLRGTEENILACMQNAEDLNIKVIPELWSSKRDELVGTAVAIAGIAAGVILFPSWQGFVGGWLGAMLPMMAFDVIFAKRRRLAARRRGQALKNKFPDIHGGERKARIDDADKRGML